MIRIGVYNLRKKGGEHENQHESVWEKYLHIVQILDFEYKLIKLELIKMI